MALNIYKAEIVPEEEENEDGLALVSCLVDINGKMDNITLAFEFPIAYEIQKHCMTKVEPYVIELE